MRVKIKTEDVEGNKLQFGRKYGIDIVGASFWFEFIFTRKKRQYVSLVGPSGSRETTKMSTRKLKELINDKGVTRFVFEFNDEAASSDGKGDPIDNTNL